MGLAPHGTPRGLSPRRSPAPRWYLPDVFEFQRPDTSATLDDGLREYHASRDDLVTGRGASEIAREFFRCHDVAHVVFGCSTTLVDEAKVKMWSFFGTTGGLSLIRYYRLPESKEVYETITLGPIVRTGLKSAVIVPRVLARCSRMRERWPWDDFEEQRPTPLPELRAQYGIEILTEA